MKDVRYHVIDLRSTQRFAKCKVHFISASQAVIDSSQKRLKTSPVLSELHLNEVFTKYCCIILQSFESFITEILGQQSRKICFPHDNPTQNKFSCASSRNA